MTSNCFDCTANGSTFRGALELAPRRLELPNCREREDPEKNSRAFTGHCSAAGAKFSHRSHPHAYKLLRYRVLLILAAIGGEAIFFAVSKSLETGWLGLQFLRNRLATSGGAASNTQLLYCNWERSRFALPAILTSCDKPARTRERVTNLSNAKLLHSNPSGGDGLRGGASLATA